MTGLTIEGNWRISWLIDRIVTRYTGWSGSFKKSWVAIGRACRGLHWLPWHVSCRKFYVMYTPIAYISIYAYVYVLIYTWLYCKGRLIAAFLSRCTAVLQDMGMHICAPVGRKLPSYYIKRIFQRKPKPLSYRQTFSHPNSCVRKMVNWITLSPILLWALTICTPVADEITKPRCCSQSILKHADWLFQPNKILKIFQFSRICGC